MKSFFSVLTGLFLLFGCAHNEAKVTTPEITPKATGPTLPVRAVETPIIKGAIQSYLWSPRGEIDGIILKDGRQVAFAPQKKSRLLAVGLPADTLLITGTTEFPQVITATKISNPRTGKTIDVSARNEAPASALQEAALKEKKIGKFKVKSIVKRRLYGPDGQLNGLLLVDGSLVRFTPQVRDDAKGNLEEGDQIRASGDGYKDKKTLSLQALELYNF